MTKYLLLILLLSLTTTSVFAYNASFEWDPVNDLRVGKYVFCWGTKPGIYTESIDIYTPWVDTTIELKEAGTYYFAVKACSEDNSQCSEFSEEIKATLRITRKRINRWIGKSQPIVRFIQRKTK